MSTLNRIRLDPLLTFSARSLPILASSSLPRSPPRPINQQPLHETRQDVVPLTNQIPCRHHTRAIEWERRPIHHMRLRDKTQRSCGCNVRRAVVVEPVAGAGRRFESHEEVVGGDAVGGGRCAGRVGEVEEGFAGWNEEAGDDEEGGDAGGVVGLGAGGGVEGFDGSGGRGCAVRVGEEDGVGGFEGCEEAVADASDVVVEGGGLEVLGVHRGKPGRQDLVAVGFKVGCEVVGEVFW